MQVSIYLNGPLVERINKKAKKLNKSRSCVIQNIIKEAIMGKKEKSVFDDIFGILDEPKSNNLIDTIYKSRKNSPRFL